MFNLIVRSRKNWGSRYGNESMPRERFLEHTEQGIRDQFITQEGLKFDTITNMPCLFMEEGTDGELAYVGSVIKVRLHGRDIVFDYALDPEVPPLTNKILFELRSELLLNEFEFSRNHWAIKEVDLYRFLLRHASGSRQRPKVFNLLERENIDPGLASTMMPFDGGFDAVYDSIKIACGEAGLTCRRADNIWLHSAIIQDVVTLIDQSRVVICDCTGKNPNVFYELGIAHSLGREVIMITQSESDVPFDLRHLRYIKYLNNDQGRLALQSAIRSRLQTVLNF